MIDSGWQGKLELQFAETNGKTQVTHNYSQAPLRVQRSFYPEGQEVCHSVILHTAGGIVGGDRLDLDIQLQPRSQALITTATAAKIYRSNGLTAQQTINLQLQAGTCLEWLPQETIVFDGVIYQQKMRIELLADALWLGWEIVRFGRSAGGERLHSGSWRSHTEVWREGIPLWIDRQWLQKEMIDSPHGLDGNAVVGSLVLVGKSASLELVENLRSLWTEFGYEGEVGVTRLLEGVICRYRGHSTLEVRHWLIKVWQLLRAYYLNKPLDKPLCLPRVWP